MPVVEAVWYYCSFNSTNILVVASRGLWYGVSSAIRFLFLDITCFMVENVLLHTYVLPKSAR